MNMTFDIMGIRSICTYIYGYILHIYSLSPLIEVQNKFVKSVGVPP